MAPDAERQRLSQPPPLQASWVIPNRLMVGPRPRRTQQSLFEQLGFRSLLTLHKPQEAMLPDWIRSLEHRQIPLPDSYSHDTLLQEDLAVAVDTLAELLEQAAPVYVHCLAGIERSPLVCMAYLCRYRGLTLTSALSHLQQMHPSTCPTEAQIAVLRRYLHQAADTREGVADW